MAASMGAFLLAGGAKGKRQALPNAEIMIHQPSGGTQGKASDMLIDADHIRATRQRMNELLAQNTGKTVEEVARDTDRDHWLTAKEAAEYGIIDSVIEKR